LSGQINQNGQGYDFNWLLLLLPAIIYLFFLYIIPISKLLSLSLYDQSFTLKHFKRIFEVSTYIKVLWITFRISFVVTFYCLLFGYAIAYLIANVGEKTANILMILILIPFWTSILVRTYAWMVLLGRHGLINQFLLGTGVVDNPIKLIHNTFGVYVGMIQILLPYMILPIYSVMKGIDINLMAAAHSLGARPYQAFIRIYLPLSLPGVFAGTMLVFILCLGFFITPVLLGGLRDVMISKIIERHINELLNWPFAAALGIALLILTAATFVIFKVCTRLLGVDSSELTVT
jgi:putative spermidine/putrescine transport system permease protein